MSVYAADTRLVSDPVALALTAEGVVELCESSLTLAESASASLRALVNAPAEQLTWSNTFGAMDDISLFVQEAACVPGLIAVVHPDEAVRQAAQSCDAKIDHFTSGLYLDDAIAAVLKRYADKGEVLSGPQTKLLTEELREYRRNGLELPEAKRAELRSLNERLTKLGLDFETNLAEVTASLEIKPEQLTGLPESYIKNHPAKENGLITITTDYPDSVPFMKYALDRKAARELYILSENRCAEKNIPILTELLKLRHEKAQLLGYQHWADFVLDARLAKSADNVKRFIDELHDGLIDVRKSEEAELLEVQRRLLPSAGDKVSTANTSFLGDQLRRERFALDSQAVSEYFEGAAVLKGIMNIASHLYGIAFVSVTVPTWHSDVQTFNIVEGERVLGLVYLDLYPRENKYKHAAKFGLRNTRTLTNGERQVPSGALVCNFVKPGTGPALMSHDEVTTFFHEFGHLLHHLLSESELSSFGGTNVAHDFVEVPSQLFEEWAWDREALDTFSRHYKTGAPLPDDLFKAMTDARRFGLALGVERQLFLGAYDQACHTLPPGFDVEELARETFTRFSSFERVDGTHFPATFGHLIGYCSAYYGYQWALSIAIDVFSRFKAEGLMNPAVARAYRKHILAPGGTVDELKLVENFLGRPSTPDAYLKHLGIQK